MIIEKNTDETLFCQSFLVQEKIIWCMGIHDSIDKLYIVQKKTIHEKTYHIYGALLQ